MKTDTHYYDGKLINKYKKRDVEYDISKLNGMIKDENALRAIKLIDKDRRRNYDGTNEVDAMDLLKEVGLLIDKDNDLLPLLEEQLKDIVLSGPCPQGRCTRLLQLYLVFKESQK